jgi:hypothetical protein
MALMSERGAMQIHLYALCWNDIALLDFFFRNYEPWVDRFFIADDHSDDGSREYLGNHPKVTVTTFTRKDPHSFVLSARRYYNSAWHQSRSAADWVVVTNIDEHLYHPDMRTYLEQCKRSSVTAIPSLGYQMLAPNFPSPDCLLSRDVRRGVAWHKMSKLALFDPNAIDDIGYGPGRHRAKPTGRIRFPERDEVLNLHYKYLGLDYIWSRQQSQAPRLLATDRQRRFGHEYLWDLEKVAREMSELESRSFDVMDRTRDHDKAHGEVRWWRVLPEKSQT